MRNLRVIGKMIFPHQINYAAGQLKKESVIAPIWNESKSIWEDKWVNVNVMQDGTFDVVSDPSNPIVAGDEVSHYAVNARHKVNEVLEQRPAKGDWSFTDIAPIFQRLSVSIV